MLWRFFSVGESVYFNVEQECLCVSSLSVSLLTSTESRGLSVCFSFFFQLTKWWEAHLINTWVAQSNQNTNDLKKELTDWLLLIFIPRKNQFNFTEIIILAASSKRRKKLLSERKVFVKSFFFLSKSLLVHLIRRSGKHVFSLQKQICSFIKKAKFETTASMKNVDFATFVLKLLLHR
jgi:hypothetical protein